MSANPSHKRQVGDIRPSQLMFSYGVGAVIDLPKLSVLVAGLEDWSASPEHARTISEERLLSAVRYSLPSVEQLKSAPIAPERGPVPDPFGHAAKVGVGVIPFPRWLLCPYCRTLAPLTLGFFELSHNPYRPDRTVYRHVNCNKAKHPPEVVPARFVVACEDGHLDDFPWVSYAHTNGVCANPRLQLIERGPGGDVAGMVVRCSCEQQQSLAFAFSPNNRDRLPFCRGRRPHLRDFDPEGCTARVRPLILGASNTWFPSVISSLAIPLESGRLQQGLLEHWATLRNVLDLGGVALLRSVGKLGPVAEFEDEAIFEAIEERRQNIESNAVDEDRPDIKGPEWQVFTRHDPNSNDRDFKLRTASVPREFDTWIEQVVLVERLREVRALLGFTRLDSLGEMDEPETRKAIRMAPLSRQAPRWVPANEVRGEGIFIQLREQQVRDWEARAVVVEREAHFQQAHAEWRKARLIEPADAGFPGSRYLLIHSLAHLLMRQLALEAGYAAPSIRERIYARVEDGERPAMAGFLIYTAAPDSEGTLGGLVQQGEPAALRRHLEQALETARLCANDPLCAERPPDPQGQSLHAASCHACNFAPETSCERGNKYLDRALVVPTIERSDLAFFDR